MNLGQISRLLPLVLGAAIAVVGCSDGDDEKKLAPQPRSLLLNQLAGQIAQDALSATPSQEFVIARDRVQKSVPKNRRTYVRGLPIASGRGGVLIADSTVRQARGETAIALGVTIDETKASDVTLANASVDALLAELTKRFPGAASCEQAGEKAEDCAIALLVLEVQRSEAASTTMDGGFALPDGGVSEAGTLPDAAVPTAGSIECLTRDVADARIVMGGTISASETWSGKILIKGDLYVSAATLTIAPGTQIFMDVDSSLQLGWNNAEATIIADGTAAQPIRFCGKLAEPGYWDAITVGSNVTSNSVLRNVLIADGAGETGAALQLDADITIDNLQVRNAQHSGVEALDFKEGSKQLTVEGTAGPAVVLTGIGAATRFPLGGSLRNNSENVVRVRFTSVNATTTFHNVGIPYLQEADVYTSMGELTFEAGVEYRFQADTALEVGWNSASAGLHVNGTAAAPVVFRAASDATTSWSGMRIYGNVLTNSNLTYAEIRQAGTATEYALSIEAAIKVDHVTLRDNTNGMLVGIAGLAAGSNTLTITGTKNYPLVVKDDGIYGLPKGGTFTGNMIDQIKIDPVTFDRSGTIEDLGIPYLLNGRAYVMGGAMMTIAAGTDFLLGADAEIEIGWNSGDTTIIADGTAAAPITFKGLSPTAGFWGSIIVGGNVRTNSKFNYVEIAHGGQGATALLDLGANVPVTNSTFSDSAGWGIAKKTANTIDYAATNTFTNTPSGNIQVK